VAAAGLFLHWIAALEFFLRLAVTEGLYLHLIAAVV
jgi:hypothetical protein